MSASEIMAALAAPFPKWDVSFRPQGGNGNRCLAVVYINARAVMDRLDAVFGIAGWKDEYFAMADGMLKCRLSVKIGDEWISKEDGGKESAQPDKGDRGKSSFSDSLKRCAVKFGVGRYLYRLKSIWVDYDPQKKKILGDPWNLLPPDARPEVKRETGFAPAPAPAPAKKEKEPAKGTVYDLVDRASGKAFAEKWMPHGDALADVVHRELSEEYGTDMRGWPEESRAKAIMVMKEAARVGGDPMRLAIGGELKPILECGQPFSVVRERMGWAAESPDQVTLGMLRDFLDRVAEKAAARKDAPSKAVAS